MQAVAFHAFGAPDVLEIIDRTIPSAGPGEVVVRVAASTINPTDLMMRRGQQAGLMKHLAPPYIAGMEFSGHLHAVGPGVMLERGQPVIGVVNPRLPAGGAQSQFICAPAAQVAALRDDIDLVGAATVPMNALTAMRALEMAAMVKGQVLLVTGAAGILGGTVVQLAKHDGLVIVANARAVDHELLRSLGVDVLLPRDEGLHAAMQERMPHGADALIDGALIGSSISSLVRSGGAAISLRRSHPVGDPRLRCDYVSVTEVMARTALLQKTASYLASGVLRPRVATGGVFPFREAVNAYRFAENPNLRGRVVLTFTD